MQCFALSFIVALHNRGNEMGINLNQKPDSNERRERLLTEVEESIKEFGEYRFDGKVIYTREEWDFVKGEHADDNDHGEGFYDEVFETIDREIKKLLEWN